MITPIKMLTFYLEVHHVKRSKSMAAIESSTASNIYDDHFSTISRGSSGIIDGTGVPLQRQYSRSRNGRCSPSHSAHGCLMRTSLRKLCQEKRARKIYIYINGDKFFKGIQFAVSSERFRSFEALLEELTRLLSDYQASLPKGVRIIFNLNGTKMTCVEELMESHEYICASSEPFKNIEYSRCESKAWNANSKFSSNVSAISSNASSSSIRSTDSSPFSTPSLSMDSTVPSNRNFIRPRLITVIRNGIRPRKAVRILLNKKTAHSFDQVLSDITDSIKLDTGAVRKVFTLDGSQVTSLEDFFKEAEIFIAYGQERYSYDDFDLDCDEIKFLKIHGAPLANRIEQFAACHSPVARRKRVSSGNKIRMGSHKVSQQTNISQSNSMFHDGNDDFEFIPMHPVQVTDHYDIGDLIGDGYFSVVRRCRDRKTKKEYAVKIIDKSKTKGKEHKLETEVKLMRKIEHPNIVSLICDFDFEDKLYIVMSLLKGGDLFDSLTEETKFSEVESCQIMFDLMQAVNYLHSLNIVHRDIKLENLLVDFHPDGKRIIKLADFGLAVEATETLYLMCGTTTYVAPEMLAEGGYGLEVDIWAAGVIMYILLSGCPPFYCDENRKGDVFEQILYGEFDLGNELWASISSVAKGLILGMLTKVVEKRLSSIQVLNHKWFSDITCSKFQSLHINGGRSTFYQPEVTPHPATTNKSSLVLV